LTYACLRQASGAAGGDCVAASPALCAGVSAYLRTRSAAPLSCRYILCFIRRRPAPTEWERGGAIAITIFLIKSDLIRERKEMLLLLIFWPLALALSYAVLSRKYTSISDNLPLRGCWAELCLAIGLLLSYNNGALYQSALLNVCGLGMRFTLDGFRAVWIVLIAFCWMMSETLAKEYLEEHQHRYHFFTLLTLSGTMGVFLSADLYTTFLFFEVMSLSSWAWVAHEENPKAQYASDTYLAVAVIGGLVTLMGLFLLGYLMNGDLTINTLYERCRPIFGTENAGLLIAAGILLLLGFGAKAGMFPLHFWLPAAHPVAPAPASALLSGVLTKCGMFGIIVISCEIFRGNSQWGELVVGVGAITMLWGAILGVFSVDLKRTLACSSVSQIGFMLTGLGMSCILGSENALATRGVMLHMINHSLIKLCLFLLAGAVAMNYHTLDLNELRGCCRGNKPLLFAFLMAGCSVAGIPLFSGYISKTLLHEAIVEGAAKVQATGGVYMPLRVIEWVFLISGGLTLAYISKLFYTLFILPSPKKRQPLQMRSASLLAIVIPGCLMPILGSLPHALMEPLAEIAQPFFSGAALPEKIAYFSIKNLSGALISITIGALVFLLIVQNKLMIRDKKGVLTHRNALPAWLDLERRILRPVVMKILPTICGAVFRVFDYLSDGILFVLRRTILCDRLPTQPAISNHESLDRAGHALDRLGRRLGRKPEQPSFVYIFAEKQQSIALTTRLIFASMSFGLLLFCAGLTLTLCYLLL